MLAMKHQSKSANRYMAVAAATLTLLFICTSCTTFGLSDANKLQMGMSATTVEDLVSKGPKKTFDFTVVALPGSTFKAMVFDLALGSTKAEYYAVFKNDGLYYWGHPYEFNRHPDPNINAVGKAAVAAALEN